MLESELQKVLKPRHLWALAVGAVCSGNYYGFSYGFETGGPGSFLLAFLPVTAMYVCFMACYMELAVSSPSAYIEKTTRPRRPRRPPNQR